MCAPRTFSSLRPPETSGRWGGPEGASTYVPESKEGHQARAPETDSHRHSPGSWSNRTSQRRVFDREQATDSPQLRGRKGPEDSLLTEPHGGSRPSSGNGATCRSRTNACTPATDSKALSGRPKFGDLPGSQGDAPTSPVSPEPTPCTHPARTGSPPGGSWVFHS